MKTKLFFLAILFSFSFSNVNAQCPEGDVQLLSQAEVDAFGATYPNCHNFTENIFVGCVDCDTDIHDITGLSNLVTVQGNFIIWYTKLINLSGLENLSSVGGNFSINLNNLLADISQLSSLTHVNGKLEIGGNNLLSSLNGLQGIVGSIGEIRILVNQNLESIESLGNITSINGSLRVLSNAALSNLKGLNSISTVGGILSISNNQSLSNLGDLENLVSLNGYLIIEDNPLLTSLYGIHNIEATSIGNGELGLILVNNQSLSTCNLPNICEYLSWDSSEYPREIFENTGDCTDEQAVLAACGLGINDMENDSANWNVHYQKNTGGFLIQTNGFKMSEIEVYDLSGKLLKSAQNLNSEREELRIFTPETILIIKVKTQEGKSFAKKVMMK